jgi:heptosyltransferase-2
VNWLGDAVMTTPALVRLREAQPEGHLTLLTHEKLADLWQHHPALDQVLTFSAQDTVFSLSRRLRSEPFEVALLFPNSPRSALEVWLARIPRRIGGAWPWRNGLLTDIIPPRTGEVRMRKRSAAEVRRLVATANATPLSAHGAALRPLTSDLSPRPSHLVPVTSSLSPASHQLCHYLHLAAALGASTVPVAPQLHVTASEVEAARQRFQLAPDRRWLGLNAGAEYGPAKRWPIERFIEVAREVAAWPGWGIVLFGGQGDLSITQAVETAFHPPPANLRNLAGQTSLRELCAALRCCEVLLTNDTGPMHVAAAVGTPVVALFGSTSPELTGPGLPGDPRHQILRARVPCAPCFLRECPIDSRCMSALSVGEVIEALRRKLPTG